MLMKLGLLGKSAFIIVLFCLAVSAMSEKNPTINLSKITTEIHLTEYCHFNGRWEHRENFSRTSAPAAMIQFNAAAKTIAFDLEGESRWLLREDSRNVSIFVSGGRKIHTVKVSGDGTVHLYSLIKISETNPGSVKVFGVSLDASGRFDNAPKSSSRRIEFIGDSFTVGFGDEGASSDDPSLVFEKTNAAKSYAFLLADGFKADFQVNAFSGRGLVRNYDNIVPEWTVPRLYEFTVPGEASVDIANGESEKSLEWNFENFHPQVIVIFIGINDFQGNPPYGDKGKFAKAYAALLKKLRLAHGDVKFLLVSTKVWPNNDLTPVVKAIYQAEVDSDRRDVEFVEVRTDNAGLLGHPDEHSHADLARTLRPIVAKLGGWLSR